MKFVEDGPDASVRIRKRGTPISGPLSDMLAETVLFCLDFAFNSRTDGARLYRLHDDIWFWGSEKTCVAGWAVMTEFAELMGLDFNQEKTGSVRITRNGNAPKALPVSLPKGDVCWGFLKLDAATGRFLIDQRKVDDHVEELRRQLAACKSVFDWIQAWNVYGARFFTNNFGRPANCFGRAHVDMMLETFSRIQFKLFASTAVVLHPHSKYAYRPFWSSGHPRRLSVLADGHWWIDLKSPFVGLYLIRNKITSVPDKLMDHFFECEDAAYRHAKSSFDKGTVRRLSPISFDFKTEFENQHFMSMEEYTRYREQTSTDLHTAYISLMQEPNEDYVDPTSDVLSVLNAVDLSPGPARGAGRSRRGRGGTRGRGGCPGIGRHFR